MAPEVLNGDYGKEADIWSVGVMIYVLVSGQYPFHANSSRELFPLIRDCKWSFHEPEFSKVSKNCKDLISKLLVKSPTDRLNGKKALEHPWFTS